MDIKVTNTTISIAYLIRLLVILRVHKSIYTVDQIDQKIDWLLQTKNGSMTIHL